MCRNIRPLFNFEPPTTPEEVRAASLQYVRKVSGTRSPSKANQAAFDVAVEEIKLATEKLLGSMVTDAPPRDREAEIAKLKERSKKRFSLRDSVPR